MVCVQYVLDNNVTNIIRNCTRRSNSLNTLKNPNLNKNNEQNVLLRLLKIAILLYGNFPT